VVLRPPVRLLMSPPTPKARSETAPSVVLLGTLDTKLAEYAYLRDRIEDLGCEVILVDVGVTSVDTPADITADAVAEAAGARRSSLVTEGDRGPAVQIMARGARIVVGRLHEAGRVDALMGIGGSGGTSIVAEAIKALPVGTPKLIVSTMAAGDTRPYVGTADVAMMYSVVDIAGLNQISERILGNAAAAIAGMAAAASSFRPSRPDRPLVAATMFGVTTPCVTTARAWLEEHDYEVLVFHATGAGGRAMESLMHAGFISGVLDATPTELVDELVGGVLSAGPERMEMAGGLGLPQVVSLGAMDMCNFGPLDTVPEAFRDRNLYVHNAAVTLMRTTPEECRQLGDIMATKLNRALGPVTVFIPAEGFSMIDAPGGPFFDPVADGALIEALRAGLRRDIEVVEMATGINDATFATAMAERLDESIRRSSAGATSGSDPGGAT
jgi:uncharacterized protein (UPF0261 family)